MNDPPIYNVVAIVPFGQWDMLKIVTDGHQEVYRRYMYQLLEKAAIYTRNQFNASFSSTRDVPDWILILDLTGFNFKKQGCWACKSENVLAWPSVDPLF